MTLRYASPATEAHEYPLTIKSLLGNVLTTASEQKIVYRNEASFTYREFVGRVGRLASALARSGVQQGMTVAVMDWDSHRYLEAYFAIPMMGAVLQTVNVRLPPQQIAYTLEHAKAQVILVHHDFVPLIKTIFPALTGVKAFVVISCGEDVPAWASGEYESLLADASPDYPFVDFDENAVATTFYTSGTTGNPKGVCFTHRQLVLHTLATTAGFSGKVMGMLGYGDVYMPLTPMFHVHAWGMPYVATMLGLKQVYPGRYEPEMICDLRREHGVTFSHCVPTVLQMVLASADKLGTDLAGWKMVIGGSALTRQLCAEGRKRGMEVISGYGMSETAPLIAKARPLLDRKNDEHDVVEQLTTAGVPMPMVQVRIVDDEMRDVPHDGKLRGELVVRAPWLTPIYVGNEQASAELWRGGWLHTQDIATIDADGYIRIRDRLKDIIKTGGEWIDSIQLEELVATAEGVAAASVVAVPDERWGERPCAVVVARPGANPTLADLNAPIERSIAAGDITRYAKLERFIIVEDLPKTSVGKIDKKALRWRLASSGVQATVSTSLANWPAGSSAEPSEDANVFR